METEIYVINSMGEEYKVDCPKTDTSGDMISRFGSKGFFACRNIKVCSDIKTIKLKGFSVMGNGEHSFFHFTEIGLYLEEFYHNYDGNTVSFETYDCNLAQSQGQLDDIARGTP